MKRILEYILHVLYYISYIYYIPTIGIKIIVDISENSVKLQIHLQ